MIQFESKLTIISIFVGVIGIVSTIYAVIHQDEEKKGGINFISNAISTSSVAPVVPALKIPISSSPANPEIDIPKAVNGIAHLVISATGADVKILEGDSAFPYSGGVISSTGAEQVIYLPKNQALSVSLSGTGAELAISHKVVKQVSVQNSGTGTDVSVF